MRNHNHNPVLILSDWSPAKNIVFISCTRQLCSILIGWNFPPFFHPALKPSLWFDVIVSHLYMMKVSLSSGIFCYGHKGKLSFYKVFLKLDYWLGWGDLEFTSCDVRR